MTRAEKKKLYEAYGLENEKNRSRMLDLVNLYKDVQGTRFQFRTFDDLRRFAKSDGMYQFLTYEEIGKVWAVTGWKGW